MALSVKSRKAGLGYAKKIVLALIQPFGFALRLFLVFYLILFITLSLFILLLHSGTCTLHPGIVSEGTCIVSPVLHCHALKTQGRNPSLLSGVLGTGLPGLGTEHLPGALCSGTGSPALVE